MRNFICIVGTIIGVLVSIVLVIALRFGVRDAVSVTSDPVRLAMHEAVDLAKSGRSAWVWLTDAAADCTRSARFTDSKDGEPRDAVLFVALNAARDIEIVVDVRDLRECRYAGNVHYIGMLKRLEPGERKRMTSQGLALPAGDDPEWWLCADCRPGGEWLAVIFVLALTGLSGWLTVRVYRARNT
jgi:hypothetical protein